MAEGTQGRDGLPNPPGIEIQKPAQSALTVKDRNQGLVKTPEKYERPMWLVEQGWRYDMTYSELAQRGLLVETMGKAQPSPPENDDPWRKQLTKKTLERWGREWIQIGPEDTYDKDHSFWVRSDEEGRIVNVVVSRIKADPRISLIQGLWGPDKAEATDNEGSLQHAQGELDELKARGIDVSPEFAEKIMNLVRNRMLEKKIYTALGIFENTPPYARKRHQEELSALEKGSRQILSALANNQTFSDQEIRAVIHETAERVLKEISMADFKDIGDKKKKTTIEELMRRHGIGKT